MSNPTELDPESFRGSPYSPSRQPPPLAKELTDLGLLPSLGEPVQLRAGEAAVSIHTKVPPALLYAIDRLIERRVYKMKSRQEFYRTALMNLVFELIGEVQQQQVQSLIYRLHEQRRTVAELTFTKDVEEMAQLTRLAARKQLDSRNPLAAVRSLRNAKRFAEEIPYTGTRDWFECKVYGSADGTGRPPGWEEDEIAVLWEKVLEGELDVDDDQIVQEKLRVY